MKNKFTWIYPLKDKNKRIDFYPDKILIRKLDKLSDKRFFFQPIKAEFILDFLIRMTLKQLY